MTASPSPKRTRSEHVASLTLPPGKMARLWAAVRRGDVLARVVCCVVAAVIYWTIAAGWAPPFGYRIGWVPSRSITARVPFEVPDPKGTEELKKQKKSEVVCIYVHEDRQLKELQSALKNRLFQVLAAESLESLEPATWQEFVARDNAVEPADVTETFQSIHDALAEDTDLTRFAQALQRAFQPFEENGLLENLAHRPEDGSQISIRVYPAGKPDFLRRMDVKDVRIAQVAADLRQRLAAEFRIAKMTPAHADQLATLTYNWIVNHGLPTTLTLDVAATERAADEALANVEVTTLIEPGDALAAQGTPLDLDTLDLLRLEYQAYRRQWSVTHTLIYSLAYFGLYTALFVLAGVFVYYHQRQVATDFRQLVVLLTTVALALALGRLCAADFWKAELIPMVLFGMTMAVAYSRNMALLSSMIVALLLTFALGLGLAEFTLLTASSVSAVLLLTRVRSRTKLIYVGLGVGAVTLLTSWGVGTLVHQPLGSWGGAGLLHLTLSSTDTAPFALQLIAGALWNGSCAVLAALIMTGLLPFVERLFGILTDISLLELGDAAHPLLQELARRAPGTYNHSISVASLSEAAAEAIGANSLLVRVGAYFHDIGKVFKPGYFVENQGSEANRHESLLPAMSTLVIIAHVKDGADLARKNHLPQSIIDFIEQHHGTTLVEYFYQQATRQSESDPHSDAVEEASYRYPGPKPQSREAAVMMVADAVESASRTLVEPTPARIENLVDEIAMKRLLDGQFDESGITLAELAVIRESLIKSLIAVYHARVKYPDQSTA